MKTVLAIFSAIFFVPTDITGGSDLDSFTYSSEFYNVFIENVDILFEMLRNINM